MMNKIKDIGEFGLINRIAKKSKNKEILVGIGDDAAVIKAKELQVLTTDCLVEGDHFRREWFTPKQIGMKAIEINVSDVAAMGANPKYVLVSLALPGELEVEFVEELYKGMRKVCDKYNIEIIGGNITHCQIIVISITLTGQVSQKNLSLRSGAKPGDSIFVTGNIGKGRAGLRLFQENLKGYEKVRKSYLEPKAQYKKSYLISSIVTSMIDISDGLAPEIKHICDKSKCGAIIYKDKIPMSEEVRSIAKELDEDEYDYALYGGEDFELVYTVSKNNLNKINGYLVGEITKEKGLKLSQNGVLKNITKKGYDHFSNFV